MRVILSGLLLVLAGGCALMQAADRLDGAQLLEVVKAERSSGCIAGWVNGSHLGAAGRVRVLALWGPKPPEVAQCLGALVLP